ncbi:MAG: succinate dehydrogenase assembly factor 2 [Methylacidiphilales bacterium]|nr:succinate dehydrogenase assembly factor 2 [Candidatus Methylacidiphilales bacterium]
MASTDARINYIRWQCKRGVKELDDLLLDYVDKKSLELTIAQTQRFITLLKLSNDTLFELLFYKATATNLSPFSTLDDIIIHEHPIN